MSSPRPTAREYRSNDATTTAADGTVLPGGNYASHSCHVNGRYTLAAHRRRYTSWIGGGLIHTQEIDLESEGDTVERSFSDAGAVGFQLLTGADASGRAVGGGRGRSGAGKGSGVGGRDVPGPEDREGPDAGLGRDVGERHRHPVAASS